MSLRPKDIYDKEFTVSKHGYDQVQVDNFLDEIILELQERDVLYNELKNNYDSLVASSGVQPTYSSATANVSGEAEMLISQAQLKANQLISEAKLRIQNMLGEYKEQQQKLKEELEIVSSQYEQICGRFYSMLETQKTALGLHYTPAQTQMLGNIPLERISKENVSQPQPQTPVINVREDEKRFF